MEAADAAVCQRMPHVHLPAIAVYAARQSLEREMQQTSGRSPTTLQRREPQVDSGTGARTGKPGTGTAASARRRAGEVAATATGRATRSASVTPSSTAR